MGYTPRVCPAPSISTNNAFRVHISYADARSEARADVSSGCARTVVLARGAIAVAHTTRRLAADPRARGPARGAADRARSRPVRADAGGPASARPRRGASRAAAARR